jgi:hypothetical protein
MSIRGSLDIVTTDHVSGWAFSPDFPDSIFVQAILNGEIIGEGVANIFRDDLAAAGFGNGECGYTIQFNRPIDPLFLPFIAVRPDGGDAELPRWTPTGMVEFFSMFYRSHPAAGRHRSVLGGLWSNRIDAAAVLDGKVEIGQVTAAEAEALGRMVRDGLTVVEDVAELPADADADDETIDRVLRGPLLRLLQLELDDQPVVLKAEIANATRPLAQPSTEMELPSPAECLLVVVPLGRQASVHVDALRQSHLLPEFNRDGVSRWVRSGATDITEAAELENHGLLDRHEVPSGTAAIVDPGLLHALRYESQARALRLLVVPARGMPARLLQDPARQEMVTSKNVHIWL